MSIKRRTVLKGLAGAAIAGVTLSRSIDFLDRGSVTPWSERLLREVSFPFTGWPVPEEYTLCMPHYAQGSNVRRVWLEMVVKPRYVPNLGTPILVELVERIEPIIDSENFKVTVLERMRRDDI